MSVVQGQGACEVWHLPRHPTDALEDASDHAWPVYQDRRLSAAESTDVLRQPDRQPDAGSETPLLGQAECSWS